MARPPARKSSLAGSSYFTPAPAAPPVREATATPATSAPAAAEQTAAPRSSRGSNTHSSAAPAGTQRIATYWPHHALLPLARGAYVADLQRVPGSPDSFARWIGQAVRDYAQLTTAGRERAALEPVPEGDGKTLARPFNIPTDDVEAMHRAQRVDLEHNQVRSRSEFITRAIRAAIATARERAGGELPEVKGRLPGPATRLGVPPA
ncbi:hypothetical protein [Allobranchiibius sp. GilTou73]|uniref:hypothetical protein n=1 Tax=Allobranchiibius sp. GilTou73 TaxID=2904523 RepID=UPI001F188DAF|nr:hypothetical protein [Allobranchiibius sp. GilTou73]UIJ35599.1 hypothetical protein LVQ62_04225 [Allobranchiibius sp. GilTou73]